MKREKRRLRELQRIQRIERRQQKQVSRDQPVNRVDRFFGTFFAAENIFS
jgi:hypothetical protein